MSEAKHTPGDWIVYRRLNSSSLRIRAGRVEICEMDHWGERQPDLTADLKPYGESEANARLIAAAPELLKACKQSIITLDPMDNDHAELYRLLADAIAKAEKGRQ